MDTTPTMIAFFGPAPDYVNVALESAAAFHNQVVMIGDGANRSAWRDHVDSDRLPSAKHAQFTSAYVKMSDYPEPYEAAFWRRPFAVESWMRSEGVNAAFLLDSDVVTFSNLERDVGPRLPAGCCAAMMTLEDQAEYDWASSLHFSYWTLDAVSDFTAFCVAAYRDRAIRRRLEFKYDRHIERREPGGICEMTLLHLWRQRNPKQISNLARVVGGTVGDLGLGTAANCFDHEYAMRGGVKRLRFRDGVPYGFNRTTNEPARFLCVHCSGHLKPFMRLLASPRARKFHRQLFRVNRVASHVLVKAGSAARAAAALLGGPKDVDAL
jgi:hypothetical protein